MAWGLPPSCVGFVEFQKDGFTSGLSATADELDADLPSAMTLWTLAGRAM
jgi:hypothetical protein